MTPGDEFAFMKGILKLQSLLFVAVALPVSTCTSGADLPSVSDSALPSQHSYSGPPALEGGESEPLARHGDVPAGTYQPQ